MDSKHIRPTGTNVHYLPPPPIFENSRPRRGRAGAAAMTGTGRRRFPVLIAAIAALAVAGTVLGMLVSTVQAQERDEVLLSVSEGATDLPNDNTTRGRVAVGGSATGAIGRPKDQDRFAVDLEAGRTYRFDLTGRTRAGEARFATPISGRSTTARDATSPAATTTTSTADETAA